MKKYPGKDDKESNISHTLHADAPNRWNTYKIKGAMGKGLNVAREGKHLAYSAGTGVLVFIDLVAHLILCLL